MTIMITLAFIITITPSNTITHAHVFALGYDRSHEGFSSLCLLFFSTENRRGARQTEMVYKVLRVNYDFRIENLEAHWRRIRQSLESHYAGLGCDSIEIEAVRWGSSVTQKEKRPVTCSRATHTNQSNPPIRITTYYIFMQVRLLTVPWNCPGNPPSASRMKQNPRTFLHFQPMPEPKTCKTGPGVLLQPWSWDLMALRCTFLLKFFLHAWRNRAHALHVQDALWACCRPGHACLQDFWGENVQSRVPPRMRGVHEIQKKGTLVPSDAPGYGDMYPDHGLGFPR